MNRSSTSRSLRLVGLLAAAVAVFAACAEAPTESLSHRPGGISKYTDGTAELEGITATASPQCPWGYQGTPPDCIPDGGWVPVGSSPQASIGDMGSGGEDSGGGGSSADPDADGPGAFVLCFAAKMGTAGWSAVLSAGVTGWELYDAREHVRDSYGAWTLYHQGSTTNPDWDLATENLFWANYKAAESSEERLWAAASVTGGTAAFLVGRAALACLPTLAVPEP